MSSRPLAFCLLAAATLIAGCFESNKPISPAGTVPYDTAVLGSWTCVPDPPLRP